MNLSTPSIFRRYALVNTFAALTILATASVAAARPVTVLWDAALETNIAGYLVSYGTTSGQSSVTVDVGKQLEFHWVTPSDTTVYYFSVQSYNTDGQESAHSAEIRTSMMLPPLQITALSANKMAPQLKGTTIILSTTATGGTAPYAYKWLLSVDGQPSTVAKTWGSGATFTWTPTVSGNYQVTAWGRSAASTTDAPEGTAGSTSMAFGITAPVVVAPLVITTLTTNLTSPQRLGTAVQFTATVTGGTAPYQYQWLAANGGASSVVSPWSSASTYTWTPTVVSSSHEITVWVRSVNSTLNGPESSSAAKKLGFTVLNAFEVGLTANKASPQQTNTSIVFTATSDGGAAKRYEWSVFNGSQWAVVSEWSTSRTFTWKPATANALYQVRVRAESAVAPLAIAVASMPFAVNAPGRR